MTVDKLDTLKGRKNLGVSRAKTGRVTNLINNDWNILVSHLLLSKDITVVERNLFNVNLPCIAFSLGTKQDVKASVVKITH